MLTPEFWSWSILDPGIGPLILKSDIGKLSLDWRWSSSSSKNTVLFSLAHNSSISSSSDEAKRNSSFGPNITLTGNN